RHDVHPGRPREGRPLQARVAEPEGAAEGPRDGAGRAQLTLDRQAAASARLLPRDRQRHLRDRDVGRACPRPPVPSRLRDGRGRESQQAAHGLHWAHGPISRVAGYYAKDIVFGQAGISPEDVDITGSYDAFTFTTMLQLEEYGFCKKGEGGDY